MSADGLDLKLILVSKETEEGFLRRIHGRYVPSGLDASVYAAVEHHNDRGEARTKREAVAIVLKARPTASRTAQ